MSGTANLRPDHARLTAQARFLRPAAEWFMDRMPAG